MKHQILLILLFLLVTQITFSQVPGWRWAVSATARQYDQANAVTTDRSGNVYVAGYFAGDSIIFGLQTLYNNTPGFNDMFIAKYDSMGNVQWARTAGGNDDDKAFAIGTDSSGNVYVTGSF